MIIRMIPFWLVFTAFAQSNKNFCEAKTNYSTLIKDFNKKENLLGFKNDAGLFDEGVCWWHSRFQRKAHYLLQFKPEQNKLSEKENKKIIRKLIRNENVISIPGFKNLNEFSKTYKDYILKRLTLWQVKDGGLRFAWINGLAGRRVLSEEKLRTKMDELYQYLSLENIAYVKQQLKGIPSHSWLIHEMKKNEDGYLIKYVDSNYSEKVKTQKYVHGDKTFYKRSGKAFMIFLEQRKEQEKIKKTVKTFCEL